jgi:type II secretory pathway pseudopilin PulG
VGRRRITGEVRLAKQARGTIAVQGFTLIELMVSFSALMAILLGFSRLLLSSRMAATTTHEASIAKEAARAMLETLESEDFGDVFALYNGSGFAVTGLEAADGDADGLPGEILFPVKGGQLREDLGQTWLFGPIDDLDCDGNPLGPDSDDHSGDYSLLPVVVRVRWEGAGGPGTVEFRTVLGGL